MQDRNRKRTITAMAAFLLVISALASGCASPEKAPAGILLIEGNAVDKRVSLTLDELKSMQDGFIEADYASVNSYGTKGYSHFKGVWIGYVLKAATSLKDDASRVTVIAGDGYTAEYSLEDIMREDYIDERNPDTRYKVILAWEENGRELGPGMDNPLQLVVGQRGPGDVNKPYWVRNVKSIRID